MITDYKHRFPQKLAGHFHKDTNIQFYTVYIPISADTIRFIERDRSLAYNFGQLLTEFSERDSVLDKFNIRFFPTLVILDKDLNIFFSGTFQYRKRDLIDNAYYMINKIKK
jgi:hypothetical protein